MFKTVNQEVKQQRLKICESCEHFVKQYSSCTQCGCYMPAKATFAKTSCPVGLWGQGEPGQNLINKIEEMILASWNK